MGEAGGTVDKWVSNRIRKVQDESIKRSEIKGNMKSPLSQKGLSTGLNCFIIRRERNQEKK